MKLIYIGKENNYFEKGKEYESYRHGDYLLIQKKTEGEVIVYGYFVGNNLEFFNKNFEIKKSPH